MSMLPLIRTPIRHELFVELAEIYTGKLERLNDFDFKATSEAGEVTEFSLEHTMRRCDNKHSHFELDDQSVMLKNSAWSVTVSAIPRAILLIACGTLEGT